MLNEVIEKTHELLKAPTCCQELKDVAKEWLESIGSENESMMTKNM